MNTPVTDQEKADAQASFAKTAPSFQASINLLATSVGKAVLDVYVAWRRYARSCENGDQSPTLPEFEAMVRDGLLDRAQPPAAPSGIEVKQNEAHDGVEIHFSSKPDEATRERLKRVGFRWSRSSSCWYAKRRPHTLALAYGLAGQPVPGATQSASASTPSETPAPIREPEMVRDPGEDAADRWAELHMQDACNA